MKTRSSTLGLEHPSANIESLETKRTGIPHRSSSWLALLTALLTHITLAAKPAPTPSPQPSSGTLVLSYPDANNWSLAAASSGAVYAVGNNHAPGIAGGNQLTLASNDHGTSWSLLDEFAPTGRYVDFFGAFDLGGGITPDSAGNLYVSGLSYPDELSNEDAQWYVRRSTDGGATWMTVDNFVKAPVEANADDIGIAADTAGNVYVVGTDFYQTGSNWYPLWTVRRGIAGTSFSTLDAVPNSRPTDVLVHPTAGVFVVGTTRMTLKNQTSDAWLVRRSTNGVTTWSNVDTFQLASSKSAVAMGVIANTFGIYVVGSAYNVTQGITSSHWIVRKSTNGGSSWVTVDDYQVVANNSTQACCIASDPNGNLFVAGSGAGKWIVRKSAGGTGPWTTVDVFQNGSAATIPNAIAADSFGNVFVGGNDGATWLIKKY